jgi:mannan endo-1,4-beta-mannosidase
VKRLFAASLVLLCACGEGTPIHRPSPDFVTTDGVRFRVRDRPFRFAGANVAVMYKGDDRSRMAETLRRAAQEGARVVRIWAHSEGGIDSPVKSLNRNGTQNWERRHPFRFEPDRWNEEAFAHMDRVVAEAEKNGLYVQICLANWWRDTGGVTQYLYWTGNHRAADDRAPYGIDVHEAMEFYSDPAARRMYQDHVERIVLRRNTVTGRLYRDDPTIFAWELINEAQAPTWRWNERRAWVKEMSAFVRSLDPNHLITPGIWGYRNGIERRLWIEDHRLPDVDFAVVHHYPKDDQDTFDVSPATLGHFLENRAAAAVALGKPVVVGEFGVNPEGYGGFPQTAWYRALFDHSARLGLGGVLYWILTPDPHRGYGVTHVVPRDRDVLEEIRLGGRKMDAASGSEPPEDLRRNPDRYAAPNVFRLDREPGDPATRPAARSLPDGSDVYIFRPEAAVDGRFERLGAGKGYVWGSGIGFFEYVVPPRKPKEGIKAVTVRAALRPVEPWDSRGHIDEGDVTLAINGVAFGTHRVRTPAPKKVGVYQWKIDDPGFCAQAGRGDRLSLRFSVAHDAERPFGLSVVNVPPDTGLAAPVEVTFQ